MTHSNYQTSYFSSRFKHFLYTLKCPNQQTVKITGKVQVATNFTSCKTLLVQKLQQITGQWPVRAILQRRQLDDTQNPLLIPTVIPSMGVPRLTISLALAIAFFFA